MYVKQYTSWDTRHISEEHSDNKVKSNQIKELVMCFRLDSSGKMKVRLLFI